jgi:hypothetical protein
MLKEKRREIIDYITAHANFIHTNHEALDIYNGNLRPYIDDIMKSSLSANYYSAIKDRIIPINILQRYVNKVSTTYSKPPARFSENPTQQEFVDYYSEAFSIDNSGMIADTYSNLFKGFAWEPYVSKDGKPKLRELSFDRFLVMSDSKQSPEEETIFIKFMGKRGSSNDTMLLFVYTDAEFDAFYMNGNEASEYLVDNGGVNLYGVIPFVYGKRQKNKLIPTLDSDMLSVTKAISVMLSDAAGAQMFSCFSILWGIDVNVENMSMSPNAFWSLKSDKDSEKTPQIGSVKPEADTQKVLDFVMNIFILWLETKGIRVGSIGTTTGDNRVSGISKIIDEMDSYEIKKKSMEWFSKDEEDLWNNKMPKIHNYWIKSGMINPAKVPPMIGNVENMEIYVDFEMPTPMMSRSEEIANVKAELEINTMNLETAVKTLHPEYTEEDIDKIVSEEKSLEQAIKGAVNGMDKKRDITA